jgi:hypothetical protein
VALVKVELNEKGRFLALLGTTTLTGLAQRANGRTTYGGTEQLRSFMIAA